MIKTELLKTFESQNIDVIISEAPETRLWMAEVQTSDGFLVIEKEKSYLFVDGRYIEYVTNNAKNVEVHLLLGTSLKDFLAEKKYKNVGIERDYLTVGTLERFQKMLPKAKFVSISGQWNRVHKDQREASIIEDACKISLEAFNEVTKYLKVGVTEKEISHKLGYLMRLFGAEKESFDSIVAFGSNAAEPHHHPTDATLSDGDIVKIDFGAEYLGWASDITRTFFFGTPKNEKLVEVLEIVKEAQKLGRQAVRPGIKTSEIDKICRDYIKEKGYGEYFTHSTGHGVGINVHELPNVSQTVDFTLEPGMVITVEPGIYIEGLGGARIEDTILVTKDGYKTLSRPEDYK
ncbi:aminopeptidase P family protein [Mycoplasma phocoenae]|uniref:Aminopeptidase P family protein n=1 Tax=Mycoplasma phocoenae TaxID=754517 RepID=A0A858U4S8_9MOLU|nr:aminopeptidase P family protein [Mycoplasma phocoenae]QJG67079.1 aminopeptidase P family protein [Mycoplasma phocoenae]